MITISRVDPNVKLIPSNENHRNAVILTVIMDVECNVDVTGTPKRARLEVSREFALKIWALKYQAEKFGNFGCIMADHLNWEGGSNRFHICSSWIEVRSHSLRFCGRIGGPKSDMLIESASDFPLSTIIKHFGLTVIH